MTTTSTAFPAPVLAAEGRFSDSVAEALLALGIDTCFGIIGGACAPLADAFGRARIRFVHTRHEAGAAFAAAEYSLASSKPVAVLVTTGPGILNALNGLVGARWDGAHVVAVAAVTAPAHHGRLPVQETSRLTVPYDALFAPGTLFDHAALLSEPGDLVDAVRRIELGLARPQGFTAMLGVSMALQNQPRFALNPRHIASARASVSSSHLEAVAAILDDGPLAIWVGYGARHAARDIRALVERTGAVVMCTPRAKGVFPERHPQFIGVTGAGGHASTATWFGECRPQHVLVLGSRLGEASSFWDERLLPADCFVHVDVDARVFGAGYPQARTLGIEAEIGAFVDGILPLVQPKHAPELGDLEVHPPGAVPHVGPVRASVLMDAVQRIVVDGSDASVLAESGNAFGFGNHHLRFDEPARYRSSAAWGSMGHMTCGVIGTALATKKPALALVGDGAMLMNNEINTAVDLGVHAIWVVLNDAGFGIVRDGMTLSKLQPLSTTIPRVDFVGVARAMGAAAVRVDSEDELDAALRQALEHDGPFLIDVQMSAQNLSPAIVGRVASLEAQYVKSRNSGGK
jgi:acetolactate synthase-1/2/3 large subunit